MTYKKSLLEMAIKSNVQHEMFLKQHITEYIKNNNIISVKPRDLFYHDIATKEAEFHRKMETFGCIILDIKNKTGFLTLS